jgi:hypothetical protein
MRRATLLVIAAALTAAPRCGSGAPRVDPSFRELPMVYLQLDKHDDVEGAEAVIAYPDDYFRFETDNLLPVGHPDVSAADCVATPDSNGCRIAAIRALTALQGVAADQMCMSARFDLVRKLPGWEMEEFNGVPFDPAWLIRIDGPTAEADAARFRGGLEYRSDFDGPWLESLEHACCHDGIAGNCGPADQCARRYGSGNDIDQTYKVSAVVADVRNADYRQWVVSRVLARFDDSGADCITLGIKTGRFQYYDGPDNGDRCHQPGSNQWIGPVQPWDPCASTGQPLSANPYGPGEFEAAFDATLDLLLARIQLEGRTSMRVITIEKPNGLPEKWTWLDPPAAGSGYLVGDLRGTIYPFGKPPPSTRALLWPPPLGGVLPVEDVDLGVEISGGTEGPIDVYAWCDCVRNTEDPAEAQAECGTDPGQYYEVLGTEQEAILFPAACDYTAAGTYHPKTIVVRGGDADEDRIALFVDP